MIHSPAITKNGILYINGYCEHDLLEERDNEEEYFNGTFKCLYCGKQYKTDHYHGFMIKLAESENGEDILTRIHPCPKCGKVSIDFKYYLAEVYAKIFAVNEMAKYNKENPNYSKVFERYNNFILND